LQEAVRRRAPRRRLAARRLQVPALPSVRSR
jgi:hypothetical protein